MQVARELRKNVRTTLRGHGTLLELSRAGCLRDGAYPRKSRLMRYLDLLYLSLRWGERTPAYYAQEADRKGRSVSRDYLSYRRFKSLRDRQNRMNGSHPFDYCCFLQDKLLLERHLRSNALRTASTLGVIHPDLTLETTGRRPLGECLDDPSFSLRGFCKPQFGLNGNGVFLLSAAGGELTINEKTATPDDLKKLIDMPYLVQTPVEQHPELARLHPRSVNTLRIVTIMKPDDVEVFIAFLRIGGNGSLADNSKGGKALVAIDADSHYLEEVGYWVEGEDFRPVTRHPNTGVVFGEVKVPLFDRCCEVARSAHRTLPAIRSVGWDLAVEPDDVCFLEGNDSWSGRSVMWLMPDFPQQIRQRFAQPGRQVSPSAFKTAPARNRRHRSR